MHDLCDFDHRLPVDAEVEVLLDTVVENLHIHFRRRDNSKEI
jgi:hypothetical protein